MADTLKPTIYLIKADVAEAKDIFKDAAEGLDVSGDGDVLLYYKDSHVHPPKWLSFVRTHYTVDANKFKNASAYAAIVLKVEGRFFAIPLGMGSHLMDMAKIEYNFGLKVAINCIPKNELRQLDLTTPEANSQKTKKQAVKNSTAEDFGVNKQKDILRGVVGKLPEDHPLGERIEGKDSVRISTGVDAMEDLKLLCQIALRHSTLDLYKESYPWIDNMAIISDPPLVDALYSDLITAIKESRFDGMHLAAPEFVDNLYDYAGFVFTGNKKRKKEPSPFPIMADVVSELGEEYIRSLDRDALSKSCKVYLQDEEGKRERGWPLSRCILWEHEKDGNKYVLSEGLWYKIDADFYQEVCSFFSDAVVNTHGLPEMSADAKREADYNAHVRDTSEGLLLFDLGHADARHKHICDDANEICDLYDVGSKKFIHVKIGKSSSDIGHLLRQGAFSAMVLKRQAEELTKFRQYLFSDGYEGDTVPEPYTPSDYTITFVAVLGATQDRDIPFFSKVTFRDTAQLLHDMGYKYEFGYVTKQEAAAQAVDDAAEANPFH